MLLVERAQELRAAAHMRRGKVTRETTSAKRKRNFKKGRKRD